MSLDWLIVGGGIHGVHIAARLISEGASAATVRILDPAPVLLARWRACTAVTGMTHLRSPSVHHLDMNPWSLLRFAGKRKRRPPGLFAHPYDRPSLALFDTHCDRVVQRFGLDELHLQGRAQTCTVSCDDATVRTSCGLELRAQNIVLAIGASDRPCWPHWAPRDSPRVHHIFAADFNGWPAHAPETVAVVGGGISAGQVALRLVGEGHRVHLISRHPLRQHQFDSDPGWLGPKLMKHFARVQSADDRRAMIREARHRGSVPPDLMRALRRNIHQEQLSRRESDIDALTLDRDAVQLHLSTGEQVAVDRVLLATGFASGRPGGEMVDALIESASLPCARCGYPIVDSNLRWHPRVHVSGALAELELGPAARNIAGARHAGDRLARALQIA